VRANGRIASKGGAHLSGRQHLLRDKIVAAIEHKRSAGMKPEEAVADYVRDAAFTALNRFAALKMLEAPDAVQVGVIQNGKQIVECELCRPQANLFRNASAAVTPPAGSPSFAV
jgi:hypothetical protein